MKTRLSDAYRVTRYLIFSTLWWVDTLIIGMLSNYGNHLHNKNYIEKEEGK